MGNVRTASIFKNAHDLSMDHNCEMGSYTNCEGEREESFACTQLIEAARVEERCRIGRELHDSTSQLLVSLQLHLGYLKRSLLEHSCDPIFDELESTVNELHRQIRSISALSQPLDFEAKDLPYALDDLARRFARMTGLAIVVDAECDLGHNDQAVASSVFRVVQEALANIYRHAAARNASIKLHESAGNLCLSVRDDGIGIPLEKLHSRQDCGLGLTNIHARAAALGGTAVVRRLCQGTEVSMEIPLPLVRDLDFSSISRLVPTDTTLVA